jgi:ribosomal protein S18 acetylase RimI-like enzyme
VIRTATDADLPLARELYRAFADEILDAPWRDDDSEEELASLEEALRAGGVFLADDDGIAVASKEGTRVGFLQILYVRPAARGRGVGSELVRRAAQFLADQGVEVMELDVLAANDGARATYERLGFAPVELRLATRVDALLRAATSGGPTFGAVYVQTDDANAVERSAGKALPRLGRSERTEVSGPVNGWVKVRNDLADRDPNVLRALAKELSYTNGGVVLALGAEDGAVVHYTLYDSGAMVDAYSSLPEYHGSLPPGDVVALGANPTVVARLTGADPARVRAVARTAASPAELPPWNELYEQIADLMGVEADAHAL